MTGPRPEFWRGKRVFITGHTGFKGSWLCLLLQHWGADLKGYALAPSTAPALFSEANVAGGMTSEIGDVRDLEALTASMMHTRSAVDICSPLPNTGRRKCLIAEMAHKLLEISSACWT